MGNAASITIALDHESGQHTLMGARAGHPMTGNVIVRVMRGVLPGDKLKLVAVGKETVSVHRGNNKGARNECMIFQMARVLQDLRGQKVQRGTYVYPFSVDLPEFLPSTLILTKSRCEEKHGCQIIYNISATLGGLVYVQEFTILSAPISNVPVPVFLEPKTQAIKVAGIRKVGSVTFGARLHDAQVGRGNDILLFLAAINNTTVEMKVELKVIEMVAWDTKNEEYTYTSKRTIAHLQDIHHPTIQVGKSTRAQVRADSVSDVDDVNLIRILTALESDGSAIALAIPKTALDTYKSKKCKVTHHLEVELITPRLIDNAKVLIPICIGSPREHSLEAYARAVSVIPGDEEIVLTDAVLIPLDDNIAPAASAPCETTFLGDSIIDNINFLPPPTVPSLSNLLAEMLTSANDYNIIADKVRHTAWIHAVFSDLSPDDFGSIVAHVKSDEDQPRVASLIALNVTAFTCAHLVQATRNSAPWNRSAMIESLILHCSDLASEQDLIQMELTALEWTVARELFQSKC